MRKRATVAGPDTSSVLGTEWYEGATLSAAIGQENNLFTPLQLANYIATLVNGGTHYSAHLLKSVKSSDYSSVVYEYEPQVLDEIDIDPANLEAVKLGMYEVTPVLLRGPLFQRPAGEGGRQDRHGPGQQQHRDQRHLRVLRPL